MEVNGQTYDTDYALIDNDYTHRDKDGFTLSDFLIQGDECETLAELVAINKMFIHSKYSFPLIYMEYGVEHFEMLAHKLAKRDAQRARAEIYKNLL